MEKTIIVFYINVGNMNPNDVDGFIDRRREELKIEEDSIISFLIPIRNGETRVECINAPYIVDAEYADKHLEKMDKITNILESKWKK